MKKTGDELLDAFVETFGSRDGIIERTSEIVRCMAVAKPKGEKCIEVFIVPSSASSDDPQLVTFPLYFQGVGVRYSQPRHRTGHLILVD